MDLHMPTFVKATTLLTTEVTELQLELSAQAFKAKLQVEMKTRGEPTQVRRSKALSSMFYITNRSEGKQSKRSRNRRSGCHRVAGEAEEVGIGN